MGKEKILEISLLLIILGLSLALFLYWDYALTQNELRYNGKGYVSDEVWYVASARNIILNIFHLQPREVYNYGYTIIYQGVLDRSLVEELARYYNVSLRFDYSRLNGFYAFSDNRTSLEDFLSRIGKYINITKTIPGWMMPDASGIDSYFNLEHPPLGKYIIGLLMVLVGDYPFYWRLGTVTAGVLLVFFTYKAGKKLVGSNYIAGLVAAALVAVDPIVRNLSSIALLDIYVGLFTIISLYLSLERRYRLAILFILLGSLFKFNALFALIPVSVMYAREKFKTGFSLVDFILFLIGFYIVAGLLFLITQIIASIPLITYFGFTNWFRQAITGAIAWHTQVKCVGNACPTSSAPWDWFAGVNSFTLYYFPGGEAVVASGFWPIWSFSLVATIIFLPVYLKRVKSFTISSCWMLGVLAGYIMLWLIGGRTQYSFYSIQFAPLVYLAVVSIVASIDRRAVLEAFTLWKNLWFYIEKIVRILLLVE
ncbi:glycosyltransferase family 39 protein [Thermogladius sp. 4427co]|uniref:glycosyltransferase family 39 protein n=1 Tax=Thermogladius sp. 4427co TaxID=3450718 RepID=UPI003F7A000E